MDLEPVEPRRRLLWPPIIEELAEAAGDPASLYLVGGVVRDIMLGRPIHDVDLATAQDGLQAARQIANALGAAYYPIDRERHTGRVLLLTDEREIIVDVASFRGNGLLEDLAGRDFTINAMAARLDQPGLLLDPLGGQADLFDIKQIRQCSLDSIANDPVRALRAVRQAIQFNLRLEATSREAARGAAAMLVDDEGDLRQPERCRDELFKMLMGGRPAGSVRLLHALDLLRALWPGPLPPAHVLAKQFRVLERLNDLITLISPRRDDNAAADLTLGLAVMVLDRHRQALQEHLEQTFGEGRRRTALLLLAALSPASDGLPSWSNRLRLSNGEKRILADVEAATEVHFIPPRRVDDRQAYRYFAATRESGIDGVLLALATYLAQSDIVPDAQEWGRLLDEVASPLLDAYFRRHQQVVAPPPLLTGNELMNIFQLKPGPQVGEVLNRLIEEQAAGSIRNKKQALDFASRLIE